MSSRSGLLTGGRLEVSKGIEEVSGSPHFAGRPHGGVILAPLDQRHGDNLALCVEYCHPHGGAP